MKYVIFHIEGGIGKNIIATSVVKSIKSAYPEHKLIVVTGYPEVYLNNPNIFRVYKFGYLPYFYENYIEEKNSIILRLEPYHSGDVLYKRKNLSEVWCDIFNIPCINTKPEIFLTQRELLYIERNLQKNGPILLIHPYGGAETQNNAYSWARDFPPLFVNNIVKEVKDKFSKILVIGRENQPNFEETTKITDNLRNLFCYIFFSDKILAVDSFVQHAAAALNKKATVGWIYNSPIVFGHNIHDNIVANGTKSFRHKIDSYLEDSDWIGNKFYECPYDDLVNIFNKQDFITSILK
jgi:ADP-heptose:LPS heptosyltransferase